MVKGPTCFKGNLSAIDVILVNQHKRFKHDLNVNCSLSDFHNMVCISTRMNVPKTEGRQIVYRSFKHFNENDFNYDVSCIPMSVCNVFDDIDDATWCYDVMLKDIIEQHAPMKTKFSKKPKEPFMNSVLRKNRFKMQQLRNAFYKDRKNIRKRIAYNKQRNTVLMLRRKSIQEYFNIRCTENKATEFWPTIKPFISAKHSKQNSAISLKEGEHIISNENQVCDIFNEYFSQVAATIGPEDSLIIPVSQESVRAAILKHKEHPSITSIQGVLQNKVGSDFDFTLVSEETVSRMLHLTNSKKATGFDHVHPKILKLGAVSMAPQITMLLNKSISLSKFPHDYKKAEVTCLHKKDDPLDKRNYRPVSVLPAVSKIYERSIEEQVVKYFESHNLFNNYLSAFRKHFGCQSLLTKFVDDIKTCLDNKEFCGTILADLSKAFDCIPHQLVIAKFRAYGFSEKACQFMASYLAERCQRVKLGSARSEWAPLTKGVPQGSILGPLVFNVFINDIFNFITKAQVYNYADDTTIMYANKNLSEVKAVLKRDADKLVEWFSVNGMKANPDKFQAILFKTPWLATQETFEIVINDNVVHATDCVKLLGVYFDDMLSFTNHIDKICMKAGKQLNALKRISSYLCTKDRVCIYKCFIVSNFNYCAPVWTFCSKENEVKIENVQKRALRYIYKDYKNAYDDMLKMYEFESIKLSRMKMLACEVYKCIHKINPPYLWDIFAFNKGRDMDTLTLKLTLPAYKTVRNGYLSFHYYGSRLYNQLPNKIKEKETLTAFRNALKDWKGPKCKCDRCLLYFNF
jgi:hypothetical protein